MTFAVLGTRNHHLDFPVREKHALENWLWYTCLKQAAVTFEPYLQWLCNLRHSISDTIKIKMVPRGLP